MQIVVFGAIGRDVIRAEYMAMDMSAAQERGEEVDMFFDSIGGSLEESRRIESMIEVFQARGGIINGYAVGKVASAAVAPFLAIKKERRFAMAGAEFLIHEVRVDVSMVGSGDLEEISAEIEALNAGIAETYAAKLNVGNVKAVRKMMKQERWIGTAEAIEAGFVSALMTQENLAFLSPAEKDDKKKDDQQPQPQPTASLLKAGRVEYAYASCGNNDEAKSLSRHLCITGRLLSMRHGTTVNAKEKPDTQDGNMDKDKATMTAETKTASAEATAAERKRVSAILALSGKVPHDLITKAVNDGTEPADLALAFLTAAKTAQVDATVEAGDKPSKKASVTGVPTAETVWGASVVSGSATLSSEDKLRKEWDSNPELQKFYFGGFQAYAKAANKFNMDKGSEA